MSKVTVLLPKIRFWLFGLLVLGMPFSMYPSIATPAHDFTSFRLGLYQLLAAVFVLACAWPTFLKTRKLYKQNRVALISIFGLAAVVIIDLLKSVDKSRGALMGTSILFLLSLVLAGWWYVSYELPKKVYPQLLKWLLWAGIIYSVLGLGQFVWGTFSNGTLGIACRGCVSDVFGFPRVNLFAAEPQFFANSLIPFFFAALAVFFKKGSRLALAALILTSLTIGLTFSRGAYIAVVVGLLVFAALAGSNGILKFKKYLMIIALVIICALASFGLMIASASWRFRSTPNIAQNTARTIVEHVSLGLIKLPEKPATPAVTAPTTPVFVSPGLIQASTTDRTGAAELALKSWRSNFVTATIGVGAGNLGPYTVKNIDASAPSNLTVYIYYVLVLAELGIVGLVFFLTLHFSALLPLLKRKKGELPLAFAVILATGAAFLVHYGFFGTYINTIYVWLFFGAILGLAVNGKTDKIKI